MTRIDHATLSLDVWDDTLRLRRTVAIPIDLERGATREWLLLLWADHSERLRLAAAAAPPGGMGL